MATSSTDTNHNELLKAFIHNGWHGKDWEVKITRAVLKTPFNGENKVFTKLGFGHVEVDVFNHLESLFTTKTPEDAVITLFLSYSPCNYCCGIISGFLEKYKDKLQLHVVFSALYKIVRPSCRRSSRCYDQDHAKDDDCKKANLKALQDLYQEMGDNLRPFNDKDWTDLQNVLGITDSEIDARKQEDESLRQDFETLMASN